VSRQAAFDGVDLAVAGIDRIVAGIAFQDVFAFAAYDVIVTESAADIIGSFAAIDSDPCRHCRESCRCPSHP
jgi:hypothetical protein